MWLVNTIVYSTLIGLFLFVSAGFIYLAEYSEAPTQHASIILIAPKSSDQASSPTAAAANDFPATTENRTVNR